MKPWCVHYQNKYPGGSVVFSESSFSAFCAGGKLRVFLQKGGDGMWHDRSEEYGALDRHDLSPIPKETRFLKLYKDGKINKAEEHDDRKPVAEALAVEGKVLSLDEYKVLNEEMFDDKGLLKKEAKANFLKK